MAELISYIKKADGLFAAGLANSRYSGVNGSFAKAVGIDYRSEPGVIKAQQKLKKDSDTTVDQLITASVHTSSGHSYHFGDAGDIYKRTSGGTWSLLTTLTGGDKILGAAEHSDGKVYFTYSNQVGTIQVSNDTIVASNNTLTNTNTNYGPVVYHEKRDKIFIGNQELVAEIDSSGTFTANKLDLKSKYEVRDITSRDIDVIVCATEKGNTKKSRIFQWDGNVVSWQFSWLFDDEIKWAINDKERIYILAGDKGELYEFPDLADPLKRPPGDFTSTATFTSNPNSKVVYEGLLHFGLYDGSSGTPFPNGVYTFGTTDKEQYPRSLNCEYAISQNDTTQITLGAISTDGSNLFVAWYDGTNYGMDVIDTANKYSGAYVEFLIFQQNIERDKEFEAFPAAWKPLPASTSVELQQARNHATSFTTIATANTSNSIDDEESFVADSVDDCKTLQLKLILTTNVNDTPEIIQLAQTYSLKDME